MGFAFLRYKDLLIKYLIDFFPLLVSLHSMFSFFLVGQAGAIRHGLSRALMWFEPSLRGTLKRGKH